MSKSFQTISIVGAGKVANYLALECYKHGVSIDFIIARKPEAGKALAKQCAAQYSNSFAKAFESEAVILAVSDDAIATVQKAFKGYQGVLMHCAGSVSIEALSACKRRAVIYPLQSIQSIPNQQDFRLLIESDTDFKRVQSFTKQCGMKTNKVGSEQRLQYHLAAVLVNNFMNALIGLSEQLIQTFDLDAEPLQNMLKQTVETALKNGAFNSQTGPAKRGDFGTIKQHERLLKHNPLALAVYKSLSNYIYQTHHIQSTEH